ncbi:ankyrin repeat domain-containing protein [Erwiniaceae bacterium L1_54_3]|nr:ankyrin repeat domain-containing protein [Pantoea formicae]MDF7647063.1 ankyrin repeat domain-containing protein [Erwiniaceae bacterium L1_54_3]
MSIFLVISIGCPAMKNKSAEYYFSGERLILAQAISSGDLYNVTQLAAHTHLNEPGKEDMTLLFYAIQSGVGRKNHQLNIISQLVKDGADPLQDVPDMGSVAEVLATSPYPAYMKALLDGGMSANAKIMGRPVFYRAATDKTLSTLALMVERGGNINQGDGLGRPVLMHALDGMQLDTVEWLLNHGANPNAIETNTGWSFMRQLDDVIARNKGDVGVTHKKLMEILQLAKQKGGKE